MNSPFTFFTGASLRFGAGESHHGPHHWHEPETAQKPVTIGPDWRADDPGLRGYPGR
jgi:hypothetical protein